MPQQDEEARKKSHVYVQTPEGEEISVTATKQQSDLSPDEAAQSAENTPTKASSEVTDGEGS